jgi:VIT1/CCC1 family predicted Fe2+/Mn2+ transporter
MLKKGEYLAQNKYKPLESEVPEAVEIGAQEHGHEASLIAILDEERLKYVGAMVLGLNDALVELTGAIAGITFALSSTKLVALSGIVTGISATLSMAASNYLAQKADGNEKALKSSVYTGIAYIVTVALMVLPYLLFPDSMYKEAFAIMIATVLLIILVFNFYISVAKDQPFFKNFIRMAVISISVAVISFGIALVAKKLLGIETL